MDPKKLISDAHHQLDLGDLDRVCELLILFAEFVENELTERFRDYSQQYHLLKSDLHNKIINYELFSEHRNQLIRSIGQDLKDLMAQPDSISDPQGRIGIDKINYGRIVHNIPSIMPRNIRKECKVRIAKSDSKLLEEFDPSDLSKPETLEITGTMEVEIKDPGNGRFFTIEAESIKEQIVEDHTHTQWIFYVTPLIQGAHPLKIRAFLKKYKDGKEKLRELSFESFVEVVATDQIEYSKVPITPYTDSGKIIVLPSNKKIAAVPVIVSNKPRVDSDEYIVKEKELNPFEKSTKTIEIESPLKKILPSFGKNVLTAKALIYGLIFMGFIGLISIFQLNNKKSAPISPIVEDTIKVDTDLNSNTYILGIKINPEIEVNRVEIDKQIIQNWTANADTSLIFIQNIKKEASFILELIGNKGNCLTEIKPPLLSDVIEIKCTLFPVKVPDTLEAQPSPPKAKPTQTGPVIKMHVVELLSPFKNPIIWVDGKIDRSGLTSRRLLKGSGELQKLSIRTGNHTFKIVDSLGKFNCKIHDLNITKDQRLIFECKPKLFNVVLNVYGNNIHTKLNELFVKLDGKIMNLGEPSIGKNSLTYQLSNISSGNHTFEIGSYKIKMRPCILSQNILSDNTHVNIKCDVADDLNDETEFYTLTAKIDPAIKAYEVRINKEIYTNWTTKKDASLIYIYNLKKDFKFYLTIVGKNGSCTNEITPPMKGNRVDMKCNLKQNPNNPMILKPIQVPSVEKQKIKNIN